jgi:type II secretory pathway pseudopilin PulG
MNKQKGQIMVEALIALGVAVVIIAAITSMIVSALSNAVAARNQDLATQYAKQGMEILRNMSKTDWTKFSLLDTSVTPCLSKGSNEPEVPPPDDSNPQKGCGQNIDTFIRRVDVNSDAVFLDCGEEGSIKAMVTVFWSDNKCRDTNELFCHSVKLESCFSDVSNITQ